MPNNPVVGLSDVVHQRVRLGILAIANETTRVEFGFLKETLELTGGNLSQHITVLEDAQLINVEKGYEGKRARTWVSLTKEGKSALREEIKQLKILVKKIEGR